MRVFLYRSNQQSIFNIYDKDKLCSCFKNSETRPYNNTRRCVIASANKEPDCK